LRFLPALDDQNRTSAPALVVPIRIERPFDAPAPRIASARVEVSFDDGETWAHVPVVRIGELALGLVVHPRDATHVSLRGTASDVECHSVAQTIVRAYAVSPR